MNQNKVIKEYADEIPKEVRDVINGLSEDIRMAIIVGLLKNEKVTFTELKKLFDLNSSSLSYHLSLMQDGGLVDNIVDLKESRSYYKATDIARLVLESLSNIVLGISTPTTRLRRLGVQPLPSTSGLYNSGNNTGALINRPDDLRTVSIQQFPSEEGSSMNPPRAEQSSNPTIQSLQTAANRKISSTSSY
jgi:DNA-binding HxlR family transcriptional regulator